MQRSGEWCRCSCLPAGRSSRILPLCGYTVPSARISSGELSKRSIGLAAGADVLRPQILLFAHGEVHLDRIDLRNRRKVEACGSHQVSHLDFGDSRRCHRRARSPWSSRDRVPPVPLLPFASTAACAASSAWTSVSSCACGIAFFSARGVSRSTSRALFPSAASAWASCPLAPSRAA